MLKNERYLELHTRPAALAMRLHLVPLAGYTLLTLLVLAPVLPYARHALFGGEVAAVDGWQNVWNLWWVHRAFTSGLNPFHTPYLYYPTGTDLHLQTLNISNGLIALPVTALFGPVAGYHSAVVLAFILAGMGGYALALHVCGHRLAAFVGGAIFTFAPFHMTKVWDGQLELIALQWLAFYAFFLLRTAEPGSEPPGDHRAGWFTMRQRDALLAGVFLAVIGYTSWYYLLFFAVYSVLFVALWLITTPGWAQRRALLGHMLVVGVVGAVLLAPILLPALADVQGTSTTINPDSPLDLILIHSANLFDFWLPSYTHPLWGATVKQFGAQWHPYIRGWNLALGYSAVALAVLGGVVAWRVAWRWAALALIALVLALGPLLHIGPLRTSIYLPYALLLDLPGVGIARRPSHFVVITTLLLAPLAALGLRWLLHRLAPPHRPLLLAVVIVLLALEYAPPRWPQLDPVVHPYYASLAGAEGAVFDLPARNESSVPLQAQITHELPILGGFVSRTPAYPFATLTPAIRQLWTLTPDREQLLAADAHTNLTALDFYNVRHIVIHWDLLEPGQRTVLEQILAQTLPSDALVYADATFSAYRVPEVDGRPFAYFGTGWHPEEQAEDRVWRWMAATGELLLVNPTDAALPVRLVLQAQSYLEPRAVELRLNAQTLRTWPVQPASTATILHLLLPPGEQRLVLHAPTTLEQAGDRELSIVLTGITVEGDWEHA